MRRAISEKREESSTASSCYLGYEQVPIKELKSHRVQDARARFQYFPSTHLRHFLIQWRNKKSDVPIKGPKGPSIPPDSYNTPPTSKTVQRLPCFSQGEYRVRTKGGHWLACLLACSSNPKSGVQPDCNCVKTMILSGTWSRT